MKASKYVKSQAELSDDYDEEEWTNLNDIETVLSSVGIQLRNNPSNWKSADDVLAEIAASWKEWDQTTQNAVATAIAGTRQRENVLTLFENWDEVEQYADVAANAYGTAAEKMEAYTDGIEAAKNRLINAWQGLAQGADGLIGKIEKTYYNTLADVIQNLATNLKILGGTIVLLNGNKIFETLMSGLTLFADKISGINKFFISGTSAGGLSEIWTNSWKDFENSQEVKRNNEYADSLSKFIIPNDTVSASNIGKAVSFQSSIISSGDKNLANNVASFFDFLNSSNLEIKKNEETGEVEIPEEIQNKVSELFGTGEEASETESIVAANEARTANTEATQQQTAAINEDTQKILNQVGVTDASNLTEGERTTALQQLDILYNSGEVTEQEYQVAKQALTVATEEGTIIQQESNVSSQSKLVTDKQLEIAQRLGIEGITQETTQHEFLAAMAKKLGLEYQNAGAGARQVATNLRNSTTRLSTGLSLLSSVGSIGAMSLGTAAGSGISSGINNITGKESISDTTGSMIGGMAGMAASSAISSGIQSIIASGASAGPIGLIAAGIAMIVSLGIAAWKSHQAKIQAQELADAQEDFKEAEENYSSAKSMTATAKRIDELAKGVDSLGNNVSLTEDEYEEFIEKSNELAEVFPEMVKYVDDAGNSVLDLGTASNSATNQVQSLTTELQSLADTQLLNDTIKEDAWNTAQNEIAEYQSQYTDLQNENNYINSLSQGKANTNTYEELSNAYNGTDAGNLISLIDIAKAMGAEDKSIDYDLIGNVLSAENMYYSQQQSDLTTDDEKATANAHANQLQTYLQQYLDAITYGNEEAANNAEQILKEYTYSGDYSSTLQSNTLEMENLENSIEGVNQTLNDYVMAYLRLNNTNYTGADSEVQEAIQVALNGFDSQGYESMDAYLKAASDFSDKIYTMLTGKNGEEILNLIQGIYSDDTSTVGDIASQRSRLANEFYQSFVANPNDENSKGYYDEDEKQVIESYGFKVATDEQGFEYLQDMDSYASQFSDATQSLGWTEQNINNALSSWGIGNYTTDEWNTLYELLKSGVITSNLEKGQVESLVALQTLEAESAEDTITAQVWQDYLTGLVTGYTDINGTQYESYRDRINAFYSDVIGNGSLAGKDSDYLTGYIADNFSDIPAELRTEIYNNLIDSQYMNSGYQGVSGTIFNSKANEIKWSDKYTEDQIETIEEELSDVWNEATGNFDFEGFFDNFESYSKDTVDFVEDTFDEMGGQYKDVMNDMASYTNDAANSINTLQINAQTNKAKAYTTEWFSGTDVDKDSSGLIDSWEEIDAMLNRMNTDFTSLNSIVTSYNNTGKLTLSNVASLISTNVNYAAALENTNGKLTLNKDTLLSVAQNEVAAAKAQYQEMLTSLQQQKADVLATSSLSDMASKADEVATAMNNAGQANTSAGNAAVGTISNNNALISNLNTLAAAWHNVGQQASVAGANEEAASQGKAGTTMPKLDSQHATGGATTNTYTSTSTQATGGTAENNEDTTKKVTSWQNEYLKSQVEKYLSKTIGYSDDLVAQVVDELDFEGKTYDSTSGFYQGAFVPALQAAKKLASIDGQINGLSGGIEAFDALLKDKSWTSFMNDWDSLYGNTDSGSSSTYTYLDKLKDMISACNKEYQQMIAYSKKGITGIQDTSKELGSTYYETKKQLIELEKIELKRLMAERQSDYDKYKNGKTELTGDTADNVKEYIQYQSELQSLEVDEKNLDDEQVQDRIDMLETLGITNELYVKELENLYKTADTEQERLEYEKKINDAIKERKDLLDTTLDFYQDLLEFQKKYAEGNTSTSTYSSNYQGILQNLKAQMVLNKSNAETAYETAYNTNLQQYLKAGYKYSIATSKAQTDAEQDSTYQSYLKSYEEDFESYGDAIIESWQDQIDVLEGAIDDLEKGKPEEWSNISQIQAYYNESQKYQTKIKEATEETLKESANLTDEQIDELVDKANDAIKEIHDEAIQACEDIKEYQEDSYDALTSVVDSYIDKLEEQKDIMEDAYDKEIEKLKDKETSIERTNKLIQLQNALLTAQKEKTRVYKSGVGWVYEQDRNKVKSAQEDLDDFYRQDQIDDLETAKEKEGEILDARIDQWKNYLDMLETQYKRFETLQNELRVAEMLGLDTTQDAATLSAQIYSKISSDMVNFSAERQTFIDSQDHWGTAMIESMQSFYTSFNTIFSDFMESYKTNLETLDTLNKQSISSSLIQRDDYIDTNNDNGSEGLENRQKTSLEAVVAMMVENEGEKWNIYNEEAQAAKSKANEIAKSKGTDSQEYKDAMADYDEAMSNRLQSHENAEAWRALLLESGGIDGSDLKSITDSDAVKAIIASSDDTQAAIKEIAELFDVDIQGLEDAFNKSSKESQTEYTEAVGKLQKSLENIGLKNVLATLDKDVTTVTSDSLNETKQSIVNGLRNEAYAKITSDTALSEEEQKAASKNLQTLISNDGSLSDEQIAQNATNLLTLMNSNGELSDEEIKQASADLTTLMSSDSKISEDEKANALANLNALIADNGENSAAQIAKLLGISSNVSDVDTSLNYGTSAAKILTDILVALGGQETLENENASGLGGSLAGTSKDSAGVMLNSDGTQTAVILRYENGQVVGYYTDANKENFVAGAPDNFANVESGTIYYSGNSNFGVSEDLVDEARKMNGSTATGYKVSTTSYSGGGTYTGTSSGGTYTYSNGESTTISGAGSSGSTSKGTVTTTVTYSDGTKGTATYVNGVMTSYTDSEGEHDGKAPSGTVVNASNGKDYLLSYSTGIENGPVTYTGLAMLHGTPSKPEYVLNNDQAYSLLRYMSTGVGEYESLLNNGDSGVQYIVQGDVVLENCNDPAKFWESVSNAMSNRYNVTKNNR